MSPYRLRPATNADGPAVRGLVFAVLAEYGLRADPDGTDADLRDIEGIYLSPGGSFDVLEEPGGEIVGSVGILRVDATTCELRKMYLKPAARGHGHGKRMLEHALTRARELGFSRMTLETATVLVEAIRLYERYGFTPHDAPRCSSRCDTTYALDLV